MLVLEKFRSGTAFVYSCHQLKYFLVPTGVADRDKADSGIGGDATIHDHQGAGQGR